MIISASTIDDIAKRMQDYLSRGNFVYVKFDQTAAQVVTLQTRQTIQYGGWTDGFAGSVRVMEYEDKKQKFIAFGITHGDFTLHYGDDVVINDTEGVKIYQKYPTGNRVLYWMKLQ